MWDVLSRVANMCGMFCPVLIKNGIGCRGVLSGSLVKLSSH